MKRLRGYFRLFQFVWIISFHIILVLIRSLFPKKDKNYAFPIVKRWARRSIRALGIEVEYQGKRPEEAALLVPNHRSYVDIVELISGNPICFVAKKEVQSWPLVGKGADILRTIWVDRKDKESRRQTRFEVKKRLKEGVSVIVFPEGTTSKAPDLGKLHKGIFYISADGEVPVIPVAIEYQDPNDAWVGDETFLPHFLRAFGEKKKTKVIIRYGDPIRSTNGEELRLQVNDWLIKNLGELQDIWGIPRPDHSPISE
ncbi:MAG: 1-acyl-sn-glycerol-3-phosphate acyltransferase [Bacteroidia bacterium]|nr:1-acyl-sn-glycerol-3-phosphate acyltransferase [Bacteroidia bacterium]